MSQYYSTQTVRHFSSNATEITKEKQTTSELGNNKETERKELEEMSQAGKECWKMRRIVNGKNEVK